MSHWKVKMAAFLIFKVGKTKTCWNLGKICENESLKGQSGHFLGICASVLEFSISYLNKKGLFKVEETKTLWYLAKNSGKIWHWKQNGLKGQNGRYLDQKPSYINIKKIRNWLWIHNYTWSLARVFFLGLAKIPMNQIPSN